MFMVVTGLVRVIPVPSKKFVAKKTEKQMLEHFALVALTSAKDPSSK